MFSNDCQNQNLMFLVQYGVKLNILNFRWNTFEFSLVQMLFIPEMANPLKPTARTRKEMATPRVWENPTTSSRVASIPKPGKHGTRECGALAHISNKEINHSSFKCTPSICKKWVWGYKQVLHDTCIIPTGCGQDIKNIPICIYETYRNLHSKGNTVTDKRNQT